MSSNAIWAGVLVVLFIASNIHSYRRGRHQGFTVGKAVGALEAISVVTKEYFEHIVPFLPKKEKEDSSEEQKGA